MPADMNQENLSADYVRFQRKIQIVVSVSRFLLPAVCFPFCFYAHLYRLNARLRHFDMAPLSIRRRLRLA